MSERLAEHHYTELATRRADVRALLEQLDRAEGKARLDLFTVLGEQQYAIYKLTCEGRGTPCAKVDDDA